MIQAQGNAAVAGALYLLPTPLGNCPPNAILPAHTQHVAHRLRHFIVENAKTARASLKWITHPEPLQTLSIEVIPKETCANDIERLLAPLVDGHDVGLMSEAGCPGVADPGALLVRRAHEIGKSVIPLVGPSSLLLALMASGLDGQRFAFHGYLPQREPERSKHIAALEKESRSKRQTQLFIETPYRNTALFAALLATCHPATLLCVAVDLTASTENIRTHSIAHWRNIPAPDLDRRPAVFLFLNAT